jgi:hypothetical protein
MCPTFLGYFFSQLRLSITFGEKWVGLQFGHFFTNPSGANPTNFDFTATTQALKWAKAFIKVE